MPPPRSLLLLWTVSFLLNSRDGVAGFYVPGVAPVEFADGEALDIFAVKMTSVITQLPYDYYSLPFCKPKDRTYKSENLGEILRGDMIVNTPYSLQVNKNMSCSVICQTNPPQFQPKELTKEESQLVSQRIREEYQVHMMVDNLPAATILAAPDGAPEIIQYEHGHRLGSLKAASDKTDSSHAFLNNHLKFIIRFNTDGDSKKHRIVGFFVEASSISHEEYKIDANAFCQIPETMKSHKGADVSETEASKVFFSYEVSWEKSETPWANRWDHYLAMTNTQIHWFSILNSLVIIFFLSGVITMIMVRTLRRDIAKYNKDEDDLEDVLEETGWKLVHGDVFRPPWNRGLLTACIGSGVQILGMVSVTIVFATLGMLSPSSRGALLSGFLFIFVVMGTFAGYHAGRLYKSLHGQHWKKTAFFTATLYPGAMATVGLFLNFFVWGVHSSGAIPFLSLLQLLSMWGGVSLPLLFLGFFFGFRKRPFTQPVRTNQIPRQVPEQTWYMSPLATTVVSGILPFGAVFIELYFIFNALWQHQFYYLFGFLFLVFIILVVSCAQISVVLVYFQLCGEDYHWRWRSFIQGGSCAIYVYIYSIIYFFTKLDIVDLIPTLLYFGYTFLICFTFWIMTGTIGFYAAFFFVGKIYGSIKID